MSRGRRREPTEASRRRDQDGPLLWLPGIRRGANADPPYGAPKRERPRAKTPMNREKNALRRRAAPHAVCTQPSRRRLFTARPMPYACKGKPPASTKTPAACIPPAWRPLMKVFRMSGAPGTPPRRHKTPAPRPPAPSRRMRNASPPQAPRLPRHANAVTPHARRRRPAWAKLQSETPCKHRDLTRQHPAGVATAPEGMVHVRRARYASTATQNACPEPARAIATNAERYSAAGAAPTPPCNTR